MPMGHSVKVQRTDPCAHPNGTSRLSVPPPLLRYTAPTNIQQTTHPDWAPQHVAPPTNNPTYKGLGPMTEKNPPKGETPPVDARRTQI